MSTPIQSIRGMNDCLPTETPHWQWVEKHIRDVLNSYSFSEIRSPILEQTALFKRTIGEATDIVEKEMYHFEDRNGDDLALRPEGTACCVRAGIQHGLLYNQIQRLWYMGPFFRHERPQKGRYRQFHQLGLELFGLASASADVEVILISKRILDSLGLLNDVQLEINTLGTPQERARYREQLVAYFSQHKDKLDEDCLRRLDTNPLRILDTKNPEVYKIVLGAPKLLDVLEEASLAHFETLKSSLDHLGVKYIINPNLVRGLDYYCHTVFEWTTNKLGAQSTVCAGGRYDGLVEQMGGKATPAVGFGLGLERLIEVARVTHKLPEIQTAPDIFFISTHAAASQQALKLAEALHQSQPELRIIHGHSHAALGKQLEKANKSGARMALILGENEMKDQTMVVKFLKDSREQKTLAWDALEAL